MTVRNRLKANVVSFSLFVIIVAGCAPDLALPTQGEATVYILNTIFPLHGGKIDSQANFERLRV